MLAEPALDGVSLAILFFGAVLRRDELRHQRYDFGVAGRDDRRRQHGVIRLNLAVGAPAREAMRAAELLRAKELGSIPGDERSATQPAKGLAQGSSASRDSRRSKQGASSAGSASSSM